MKWLKEKARNSIFIYRMIGTAGNGPLVSDDGTPFTIEGTLEELSRDLGKEVQGIPKEEVESMHGDIFVYAGFEPTPMGGMVKTTFDKNGRKAIRLRYGDGSQEIRSATKDRYMNTGNDKSVLTKPCSDAANKVKQAHVRSAASAFHRRVK
ncbi:MAG: hypothetical protein DRQ88_13040 [Epsilonproteobacteria bacterium]|nr:MAG: hypothetical protein DRQ88_13040 [Campylobacterota bacterium]